MSGPGSDSETSWAAPTTAHSSASPSIRRTPPLPCERLLRLSPSLAQSFTSNGPFANPSNLAATSLGSRTHLHRYCHRPQVLGRIYKPHADDISAASRSHRTDMTLVDTTRNPSPLMTASILDIWLRHGWHQRQRRVGPRAKTGDRPNSTRWWLHRHGNQANHSIYQPRPAPPTSSA
ncbi:hypothetical protein S40293_06560 [Stachybotrys chartarum IBT 40293]|nr:hypothetical protein S40293_06560 [Stachybotrys chartarum IBT 40293]